MKSFIVFLLAIGMVASQHIGPGSSAMRGSHPSSLKSNLPSATELSSSRARVPLRNFVPLVGEEVYGKQHNEETGAEACCTNDCSCHGVAYPIDTSPENTGLLKYQALCHNFEERDHLIDTIARNRLTDIIIGGCDGTPLPQGFKDSITSTRCQLRGLNLLNIQGALPSDHSQLETEIALQLVNIRDPWTPEQRQSSCRSLMIKSEGKQIRQVPTMNWPEFEEGFLRIATHDWTENEFIGLRGQ